jgi:hypothetical protein
VRRFRTTPYFLIVGPKDIAKQRWLPQEQVGYAVPSIRGLRVRQAQGFPQRTQVLVRLLYALLEELAVDDGRDHYHCSSTHNLKNHLQFIRDVRRLDVFDAYYHSEKQKKYPEQKET